MLPIIVSGVIALAGLWLVLGHADTSAMQFYGWLLLGLGVLFLLLNVALRRWGGAKRGGRR